jgi:hypothetical protein
MLLIIRLDKNGKTHSNATKLKWTGDHRGRTLRLIPTGKQRLVVFTIATMSEARELLSGEGGRPKCRHTPANSSPFWLILGFLLKESSHAHLTSRHNPYHDQYSALDTSVSNPTEQDEDGRLLGCCVVQSAASLPTFHRFLLPPSSEPSTELRGVTSEKTKMRDELLPLYRMMKNKKSI